MRQDACAIRAPDAVRHAKRVDIEGLAQVVIGHAVDESLEEDSRVVDEHVDALVLRGHAVKRRAECISVGDVHAQGGGVDLCCHGTSIVTVDDRHRCARGRKATRRGKTDA
jgi:hypothetical protein